MKKILIVHNKYRNLGGEDIAVIQEIEVLKNYFEVETLYFENKLDNLFLDIFTFLFKNNPNSNKILKNIIEEYKPDVVYVHNTWFKISLGIFKILDQENIKTIIKLHNFRYHCTKTQFIKNHIVVDKFCSACGNQKKKMQYFNKYFKNSYLKSFTVNSFGKKYLSILNNENRNVIVLTDFHHKFLKEKYYKSKNVFTVPNFIKVKNTISRIESDYLVYAGRVSDEKGVEELIQSFLSSDLNNIKLKIIGDGPSYKHLKRKYLSNRIEFLGEIPNDQVINIISNSRAAISATKLYEGQPTLLSEASSLGVPSIFPDTGGIKEFLPDNYKLLFRQYDYKDLTNKINMTHDDKFLSIIGKEALDHFSKNYNEEIFIKKFSEVIYG
jgi:glycosyltransferase involved in cell wall biosynthesis